MESDWLSPEERREIERQHGSKILSLMFQADAEIARLREEVRGLQLILDCHNEDVECPRSCDTDG